MLSLKTYLTFFVDRKDVREIQFWENGMGKYKVLLVEDDSMLRETLAYQLSELGFNVLEAENGQSAQKVLQDETGIRIVISDLNMPDMTGLDLVEWSQSNDIDSKSKISFILMTGYTDEFNAKRARNLGVINFLAKPFDQDFLTATIHSILFGEMESAA